MIFPDQILLPRPCGFAWSALLLKTASLLIPKPISGIRIASDLLNDRNFDTNHSQNRQKNNSCIGDFSHHIKIRKNATVPQRER
jgi:hypothetical protein